MSEEVRSAAEIQRILRGSRTSDAPERLRHAGRKPSGPAVQEAIVATLRALLKRFGQEASAI